MLFTIHSEFFHLSINILNRYKCGCFWCLEVEFYWIFNSKNILHAVADYIIVVSLRLYSNTMLTDTDSSTHTNSLLEKWKTDKRSCEKYIYVWCSIFSWHFVSHSFCIKQTTKRFWYSIESTLLLLFFSPVFEYYLCSDFGPVSLFLIEKVRISAFYALLLLAWLFGKLIVPRFTIVFLFFCNEDEVCPFIRNLFIHKLFWEKMTLKLPVAYCIIHIHTKQNRWVFHYEKKILNE